MQKLMQQIESPSKKIFLLGQMRFSHVNQASRKTFEGSWPYNMNPSSSFKSGIGLGGATNSIVNLKALVKKDRPLTSKGRAEV
jgi:hypothetical protein